MGKIRVTVFIDPESDPELYRELEPLPGRVRATRLKNLALVGLLLSKTREGSPVQEMESGPEDNQSKKRQTARKLVGSLRK